MNFNSKAIDLSSPRIMGIINVTPDSFSDGGELFANNTVNMSKLLCVAEHMVKAGADFLDVGGESTRPGAKPVSVAEEIDRVVCAVEKLRTELDVVISVDTSKPEVMLSAADAGADLINDVRALRVPGALAACCKMSLPIVLMHMEGLPENPCRVAVGDVVEVAERFLRQRVLACEQAGILRERLLIDPGFGFGKGVTENIDLMRGLSSFCDMGLPLVVGLSRKNTISKLLGGRTPKERMAGSLALAVLAYTKGARIIRTHDVRETFDALKITEVFHQNAADFPLFR